MQDDEQTVVDRSFQTLYCVSKKSLTFELSVTLSNLNRSSEFLHCGKRMEFATKPIRHCPPHLRHVATLPREIRNSVFLQIREKMQVGTF